MQDPDLLYNRCAQLLEALTQWEAVQPTWTLPRPLLVTYGRPAWDCELTAAWVVGTEAYEGDVTAPVQGPLDPQAARSMRVGVFGITIVRCDPQADELNATAEGDVTLPSQAAILSAASIGYADPQHLLNALHAYTSQTPPPFGIHQWAPTGWTPDGGEPQGGMLGGTLTIRLGLTVPV